MIQITPAPGSGELCARGRFPVTQFARMVATHRLLVDT
jgi:hypothetical protein